MYLFFKRCHSLRAARQFTFNSLGNFLFYFYFYILRALLCAVTSTGLSLTNQWRSKVARGTGVDIRHSTQRSGSILLVRRNRRCARHDVSQRGRDHDHQAVEQLAVHHDDLQAGAGREGAEVLRHLVHEAEGIDDQADRSHRSAAHDQRIDAHRRRRAARRRRCARRRWRSLPAYIFLRSFVCRRRCSSLRILLLDGEKQGDGAAAAADDSKADDEAPSSKKKPATRRPKRAARDDDDTGADVDDDADAAVGAGGVVDEDADVDDKLAAGAAPKRPKRGAAAAAAKSLANTTANEPDENHQDE